MAPNLGKLEPGAEPLPAHPAAPAAKAPAGSGPRRAWIYALDVRGHYQTIHRWTGRALQLFLLLVPWIEISGRPAFRFDLSARRLYALGGIYTAQDTIFLVLLGLATAFSLFLFTALYGRLWCGYACPQTVFLEEWIRPIETFVEGERGARMARDRGPWTWDRIWRKLVKWTLFAAISIIVAMAFMSWFAGARPLWSGESDPTVYVIAGLLAATMFWDFAWFREQFCNYLCPYARFQGALTDPESLVVSYNAGVGEPRGKARKAAKLAAQAPGASSPGACIDCKKCVAACPQGIDIREGFQLECISCARCVDACDDVFAHIRDRQQRAPGETASGAPTADVPVPDVDDAPTDRRDPGLPSEKRRRGLGLIQYTSQGRSNLLRPRTMAYGLLLGIIFAAMLVLGFGHHSLRANLARAPGTLYVVDADGWTRNTYLLQVTNNSEEAASIAVHVEGLPAGAQVDFTPLTVPAAATSTVPVILRVGPGSLARRTLPLTVTVESVGVARGTGASESAFRDSVALAATFKGEGG